MNPARVDQESGTDNSARPARRLSSWWGKLATPTVAISGRQYPLLLIITAGSASLVVVLLLAWTIVQALVGWISEWEPPLLALRVADSLHRWMEYQAVLLSVDTSTLYFGCTIIGGGVYLLAVSGTVGGRIGWALLGLLTVGVVHSEAPPAEQWINSGAVALAWAILSLPAFRRIEHRAPLLAPALSQASTDVRTVERKPDHIEQLADVFQIHMRRRCARAQHISPGLQSDDRSREWMVNGGSGHGFRAVPCEKPALVKEVVGLAYSPDAVADLLSELTQPAGLARLRWDREELRPSLGRDETDPPPNGLGGKPELSLQIEEFVDATPDALAQVVEHFETLQGEPERYALSVRLSMAAEWLNHDRPLLSEIDDLRPTESTDFQDYVGGLEPWVEFYDWIDVRTIVKTHGHEWNSFEDHRPKQVRLIARSLLRDDPHKAVRARLTDEGHVHVSRIPGPAGPIHEVTTNGLHRTHAFALLGAPLIAAQVTMHPIPLRISPWQTAPDAPEEQESLWRGLKRCGLLEASFDTPRGADRFSELTPLWVAAPWLLLGADAAAHIAAAYERVYPGVLAERGIPQDVLGNPTRWRQWLR